MKKILITAGSGLLGLNWILDRRDKDDVHFLLNKRFVEVERASGYQVDFKNKENLKNLIAKINPDIIINTLGCTDINFCEENKKIALESNSYLASEFSKIAFKKKIEFIHISTDHLFSGEKSFYHENSKKNPLNVYGISKVAAEENILKNNPNALIIRTNFFGWGPTYRQSISDKIINSLENNDFYAGLENVFFTPISTGKLISISHKLITKKKSGIINICSSNRISKSEFAKKIADNFLLKKELIVNQIVKKNQKPVARPLDLSLSNSKLLKILKFKNITIESCIEGLKKESWKRTEMKSISKILSYGRHYLDEDDIRSVVNVLKSDFLTQGPLIEIFEKRIASYVGAKYAVAVSSATAGLHISYLALGLSKGKKILTSPITFVSTANAAHFCNASVEFVDIDDSNLIMDANKIESIIKLNPNIDIVVPVLFGGASEGIDKIFKIARSYGKKIVEDAAHGLGGTYLNGDKIGSCKYSDCTVFSLHPVKSIAAGEGGVVTTNNKEIYKKLLRLRSHGINKLDDKLQNKELAFTEDRKNMWYYEMNSLGYHYRITDIQIALANSQLNKLDKFISHRRLLVNRYLKFLKKIPCIEPAQKVSYDNSANHIFPVLIDFKAIGINRNDFMHSLTEKNIYTQVHYIPLLEQPYYKNLGYSSDGYDNSNNYYKSTLSLPLYYSLTLKDQDYIINVIENIIKKK